MQQPDILPVEWQIKQKVAYKVSPQAETEKSEHAGSRNDLVCDRHELRFLIGSIVTEQFSSPGKVIGLPAKIPTLWMLTRAAKRGELSAREKHLEQLNLDSIEQCLMHFDATFRDDSARYHLGDILTDGTTSLKGAARMPYRLYLIARHAFSSSGRARSFPETIGSLQDLNEKQAPIDMFEFDDLIETEPGLLDTPMARPQGDDDDEIDLDHIEVETEPGLYTNINADSKRADRLWLESALEKLGSRNSGVSIQGHAAQIIAALKDNQLGRCKAAFETKGDLAGVVLLKSSIQIDKIGANALAYLGRLQAVLHCSEGRFALQEASSNSAYKADAKKLIYAVHMRAPYISNGYVTRTRTIMNVLKELDYSPEGVTRLGFPNDLAQFRQAEIAEYEQSEGHNFTALPDEKGGQLLRPVDELFMAYADRLEDLGIQHKAFALHAASNYLNGLAAIIAARRLGIPSIYEVRGIWEITQASHDTSYELTRKYRMQRNLENLAVQEADRVITISQPLKEFVIEQGADPDKVYVVPNGVDVEAFPPENPNQKLGQQIGLQKGKVVIGYIGSIVHYEGLDLLLQAVSRLPQTLLDKIHIIIVGDGVALPRLKKLAQKLSIEDICTFPGRVSYKDVPSWYSLVDITPFPRRSLPVTELVPPLKPYEAMAMEKAIIVSSVKALASEIEDGKTGIIFEKNNIADLADKLKTMIENGDLRSRLGREAGNWVLKERSIKALGRHMEKVYSSLPDQY